MYALMGAFLTELRKKRVVRGRKIFKKVEFTHPFYDMKAINAQKYLSKLQGENNSYFCGSYFGYGFHEDGLNSGIDVSNKL